MSDSHAGDRALYRRLLAEARPVAPHLVGILLVSLVAVPLSLMTPLPLKIAVDSVLDDRPLPGFLTATAPSLAGLSKAGTLALAIALVLLTALLVQLRALAAWILQTYTSERVLRRFRARLFRHAQRLSLSYHDRQGSNDSIYRIQYDAQSLQNLVVSGLTPFLTSGLTLIAMVVVIVRIDWTLALVALVTVPPLTVLVRTSRVRLRALWREIKEFESSAMGVVQEVIGSLRVVKAFGQEEREAERFTHQSNRTMRNHLRLAVTEGTFDLLVGLILAAAMAGALLLGVRHVQSGVISLGELLVVMAYIGQLLTPIETVTKKVAQLQRDFAGATRAFAVLDQDPDVIERPHARSLARARGRIECRGVSFAYEPGAPVLHDIEFRVEPGARVGIAGPTGAGKTTLVNLLTRFFDPTKGEILLDGVDLRDYRVADLRRQFSIVLQEPVLFSTTLAENIAYARPEADFEDIVAAAKAARAHQFISALPDGYDTVVGERGMRLSGGERQRVALARAFLRDAPILIMDEPTSSVDVGTEGRIMESLEDLMRGRTTFMIAHRLSTLDICDVRVVLEAGRLAEVTTGGVPAASGAGLAPVPKLHG